MPTSGGKYHRESLKDLLFRSFFAVWIDRKHRIICVGIGRIDPPRAGEIDLTGWSRLQGDFSLGFHDTHDSQWSEEWFPVSWMHLVGKCGDPDRRDEHRPVLMPWPRLFREWGLELDLRRGVVCRGQEIVFGLAGWVLGEDALLARLEPLQRLLTESGFRLVWLLRGERRAFLNITVPHEAPTAWVDFHGLAYLGSDGFVQTAWLHRKLTMRGM